ncbi:unnamed protein product [Alopecurus aequalis]
MPLAPSSHKRRKNRNADVGVIGKSETDKESFDPYDPEVLAANGIEYPRPGLGDVRMKIKYWAYEVQLQGNLSVDNMITPPDGVLRHLDLMEKCWGWRRLLPMYRCARSDRPLYMQYLCEYYIRNAPESVDGHASADEKLVKRSAWTNENGRLIPLAQLCIAKEAEMMREWVINGQYSSSDPDCILSNHIRDHVFCLMLHKGSGSIAATAGAAMVGAANEAKLLCDYYLRQDLALDVALCAEIRDEARAILLDLCKEASAANGKNIAVDDHAEDKSTRINTAGKSTCTESNGNEDLKRTPGSEGCTHKEKA